MRQLLRVVECGQTIETVVGNLGDADMRFARIRVRLRRKVRFGKDLKQRCLAHLRQADNASFHKGSFWAAHS